MRTLPGGFIAAGLIALALVAGAPSGRAEQVPAHLASLAAQLYRDAAAGLEAEAVDADRRAAAGRALAALRRAGIRYWARDPVSIPGGAKKAADSLGLDLARAEDKAFLERLIGLDEGSMRTALAEWYALKGAPLGETELTDRVAAVSAARAPGQEALKRSHRIDLGDGESVELRWSPETGEMVVRASDDGSGGSSEYEASLAGRTTLASNPETGAFEAALAPGQSVARTLTAADLERLRASILGEWKAEDGSAMRISAAEADAGDVRPTREQYEREIAALQARIKELKEAKEFVWEDPNSGEIVRQRKFRRLNDPFVYKGERLLVPDAPAQIEKLMAELAQLEAERDGASLLPAERDDPVGYENNQKGANARPVRIEVTEADGHAYVWDEASFDGRRIAARRTLRVLRDLQAALPEEVKRQLLASWSPPAWLDLEATVDARSGALRLSGQYWGLHVTYSGDDYSVRRIDTPFVVERQRWEREGVRYLSAYGAADAALP